MSNSIQPWTPPDGSNNTNNKCWLNAPLYALLSNKYIHAQIKNFKTSEGVDANVFGITRNKVIEELRKFINGTTVWNQASYEIFLTNTNKFEHDGMPKNDQISSIQVGKKGEYGDGSVMLERLISFLNVRVLDDKQKIKKTQKLKDGNKFEDDTDKLRSIVSSTDCMELDKTGESGHFFSYVKTDDKKWFLVDAIGGFEPKQLTYQNILDSFSNGCDQGENRAMYFIELVKSSELQQVTSCNYANENEIKNGDIIKKNGEEQQYFVIYSGMKEDENGNNNCPKITVMKVNNVQDVEKAKRFIDLKTADEDDYNKYISNNSIIDIESENFKDYEKQEGGLKKQSVPPPSSPEPVAPTPSSSPSSSPQ